MNLFFDFIFSKYVQKAVNFCSSCIDIALFCFVLSFLFLLIHKNKQIRNIKTRTNTIWINSISEDWDATTDHHVAHLSLTVRASQVAQVTSDIYNISDYTRDLSHGSVSRYWVSTWRCSTCSTRPNENSSPGMNWREYFLICLIFNFFCICL